MDERNVRDSAFESVDTESGANDAYGKYGKF
jgi:hypothetical protein